MDKDRVAHLARLFGSKTELAKAAGVNKATPFRWAERERIDPLYQTRLLVAGLDRGMDKKELLWALDVVRCPCCNAILDDELREIAADA